MKHDFNFDNIGKREPYTVPDDFFADLQAKIEQGTAAKRRARIMPWKIVISSVASVAAMIAIIFALGLPNHQSTPHKYSLDDVEQSFAQLCEADQQYLLETYQEDVFLND